MRKLFSRMLRLAAGMAATFLFPAAALATQGHGGIEGVYAHQLAHLFFIVSMGTFVYWLRERNLVRQAGWRLIQFSALFFILWNMDAFLVHFLDDQTRIITVKRVGLWRMEIHTPYDNASIIFLYYLAKLDHLLCVPAIVFLYLGLKRLLATPTIETAGAD